jgi:predicted NUDIX family NTP pyrophosphohydrolase
MAVKRSAGLLVYRFSDATGVEVLLGHMGGPYWEHRDDGAWSIPKGEYEPDEEPLAAALREFEEEMGVPAPVGDYLYLGECVQPHGKIVTTYAVEGSYETASFASNLFTLEWPAGSGQMQQFPEMDGAGWFSPQDAMRKVVPGQIPIIEEFRRAVTV